MTSETLAAPCSRSTWKSSSWASAVPAKVQTRASKRAGAVGFEVRNRRSRIAFLQRLAVHPDHRGRRVSDEAARLLQRHLIFELGYHRLELEIYGFNERAIAQAERAGFVREGTKRRAYLRDGEWVDGVLFGVTREDLEQ